MKPSTAKAKGAKTEQIFVDFIKFKGVPNAERRHLSGQYDKGDIAGWVKPDGTRSVCVEVKSGAALKIPEWLEELRAEIANSGADTGFVAVRPKGKPKPEDWFHIIPTDILLELLELAGYLPTYD